MVIKTTTAISPFDSGNADPRLDEGEEIGLKRLSFDSVGAQEQVGSQVLLGCPKGANPPRNLVLAINATGERIRLQNIRHLR
jgi:hypothetical protein